MLFHRTQAATLATLDESGPRRGAAELEPGLRRFSRRCSTEYEAEEQFEDDELVQRLFELRDTLREQYDLKPSLSEQLADAVATEQYELAAKLRDELEKRSRPVGQSLVTSHSRRSCFRLRRDSLAALTNQTFVGGELVSFPRASLLFGNPPPDSLSTK